MARTVGQRVMNLPFRTIVWALPIAFAVHELEEWNIMAWYRAEFANPPATTERAVHLWLIGISLVGFLWAGLACLLPSERATARVILFFFAAFVFGNALQHVYWQLAFDAYAPGFLAAAFLNIPATLLISWHALRRRLVGWPYLTLVYTLALLSLVSAARAGRTVPDSLLSLHERIEHAAGFVPAYVK